MPLTDAISIQPAVVAVVAIGVIKSFPYRSGTIWPGGKEAYWGSLQVSRILWPSSRLKRWATLRVLPLRRSTPSLSPANCLRQRCSVVNPTPMSLASSLALAPAAIPSARICRAFWRSAGDVNRPRPLPKRPESFLQQSTMLLPLQGLFPYGVDPVLVP